jgi:hypothetical protein
MAMIVIAIFVADVTQEVIVRVGPVQLADVLAIFAGVMAIDNQFKIAVILVADLAIVLAAYDRLEIDALEVGFAANVDFKTLIISVFPVIDADDGRAGDAGNGKRQAANAKAN